MNVRGRDMGSFVDEARARSRKPSRCRRRDDGMGRRVREQGARDGAPRARSCRWRC
jgi:hypothetical protein